MTEESNELQKRIHIVDKLPGPIGTTTGPSPNQLLEFEKKAWEGVPVIELTLMTTGHAQSIPKQMFEEIAEKAKLTGTKVSVHLPVPSGQEEYDLGGFSFRKNRFDEETIQRTKYSLKQILDRVVRMAEKLGYNIPVNAHTAGTGMIEWDKQWEEELRKKLKDRIQKEDWKPWDFAKREALVFIPTGEVLGVVEAKKYKTPFGEEYVTIRDEIEKHNRLLWLERLSEIRRALDSLKANLDWVASHFSRAILTPEHFGKFYNSIAYIDNHLDVIEEQIRRLYDWTYKCGTEQHKKELNKLKEKLDRLNRIRNEIKRIESELKKYSEGIKQPMEKPGSYFMYLRKKAMDLQALRFSLIEELEGYLGKITALYGPPKIVRAASEVALKNTAETVSDIMAEYIKRYYKEPYKIPKFVLENVYAGFWLSRGEEHAMLIEETRKKTIEKLMKDEKLRKELGEEGIKKLVNNLIGATLDIGHIYSYVSRGYTMEDIKKEIQKVAPYVKHIHITDNYGEHDTHLVVGQGTVPWKEMLEEIKKYAEEKGMFLISEAGGWYVNFAQVYGPPIKYIYEKLNIPIESSLFPYMVKYEEVAYAYPIAAGGIVPRYAPVGYAMTPEYLPVGATVSPYHPYGIGVFSGLPPEMGGSGRRQTFTGRPLE